MKKKVIIGIASILLVISGCLFAMFNSGNRSYEVITNETEERKMNTNALTMMYETEVGSGEYIESSDNTWPLEGYVFNEELSRCENGSKLSWDNTTKRVIVEANTVEKCYIYFDVEKPTLASAIEDLYTVDGENGLYYHDGIGDYTNANQEAGDNSYRFSGANPNNYVCFGPGAEAEGTCANDNLYRIIGLFDDDKDGNYQIKLIKNTSIGNMAWNSSSNNTWSSASLNTGTLNGTYLSGLGTWASMIVEHDWEVGGMANSRTNTAKQYYATELGNSDGNSITYRAKIGLMYVTDYGYAASGNHWTIGLYNYESATDDNWLYLGSTEWTISRNSSLPYLYAFFVSGKGSVYVNYTSIDVTDSSAVRPSFYLESSVGISGGSGTSSDPYRLAV